MPGFPITRCMWRILLFTTAVVCCATTAHPAESKARVIVLTDIENEPDDAMSLVRFLCQIVSRSPNSCPRDHSTLRCRSCDRSIPWRLSP